MGSHVGLAAFWLLVVGVAAQYPPMMFTIVNNCDYPIWPAILPNTGHAVLEGGGFELPRLSHRTFWAPTQHWAGRVWARTGCRAGPSGRLTCETGDCGGRLACAGLGGTVPATLAQLSLHHAGHLDKSSYSVSLVDGFNLPMTVTPHEGQGVCPVLGCRADLLAGCPAPLQLRAPDQRVVGCKSDCVAFGSDEACCRNRFSAPGLCKPAPHANYFKSACPSTYTFPHDSPSLTHDCAAPKELKIIFCH
ncbi:pathogenesis-related thaumatin superfamily protein [Wolffia australiana]